MPFIYRGSLLERVNQKQRWTSIHLKNGQLVQLVLVAQNTTFSKEKSYNKACPFYTQRQCTEVKELTSTVITTGLGTAAHA